MLSKDSAKQLVDKVVSQTKFQSSVTLFHTEKNTTRFANSEISQNVSVSDAVLTLRIYEGKKMSESVTNVLTERGIKALVENAKNMLKVVPEGEFSAFPFGTGEVPAYETKSGLAGSFGAKERALTIKEGLKKLDGNFTGAGALNLNRNVMVAAGSSGGFFYTGFDNLDFNVVVTHRDGTAGAGSCCSYLAPPDILGEFGKAAETASAALGAVSPELGSHTVVLSPTAFADLLRFACFMLNAKTVIDGVSFATGKQSQKVFGDNFTVRDSAGHKELMPLMFDFEGHRRKPVNLIENGVIGAFLHDNITARKLNETPTGHCFISGQGGLPLHITVDGGDRTLAEIIADTASGVYINEFHYTNFTNPRLLQITGLTRNGAFLIENGKLTKPIKTVRFTESMLNSFNKITAFSSERKLVQSFFSASLVPGVRIEDFHFTSKP